MSQLLLKKKMNFFLGSKTKVALLHKYLWLVSILDIISDSCNPLDCSPPGSSVYGILQARILEWAAIPFSRGNLPNPGIEPGSPALQVDSLPVSSLSRVYSFATLWTVTCHAPLLMGFPRQEYRSGLPFPSPGDLPDPGIEPESPALAGRFFTTESSGKPTFPLYYFLNNSHCGCLQPCWAICLGGPNYLPSYQLLFFVCTLVIKFHRSEVIYAYGGFSHKLCFYSVIL